MRSGSLRRGCENRLEDPGCAVSDRQIDEFAFSLFQKTRALGMEHGSDLLLKLIHLRGTSDWPGGEWSKLRNLTAHFMEHDVESLPRIVEELAAARSAEPMS